jgi:hypothetical protein
MTYDLVAGLPNLGSAGVEHHAVDRDAKQIAMQRLRFIERRRFQRHFKVIVLLAD